VTEKGHLDIRAEMLADPVGEAELCTEHAWIDYLAATAEPDPDAFIIYDPVQDREDAVHEYGSTLGRCIGDRVNLILDIT
jgi:hypothetical protein